MNPILLGGISGIGAGGILLFLAHIAPRFGAGNFVRDTDEIRLFGRAYSRREGHAIGIFLHLAFSFFFGALYVFGVQQGVVSLVTGDGTAYGVLPLGLYALTQTVFMGGVVMPLEGHGLFGWKEDAWFILDLIITNIAWAFLFGVMMRTWG